MGNPHFVILTDDLSDARFRTLGPALESHPAFARRANVELARVERPDRIVVRVWERGSGETLACGTGACAALAAAKRAGHAGSRATIALPGGELVVEWSDGPVFLEGPAEEVFEGELEV
jgi:diaminopimelate epimerase